jgi:lysophospholipid acyltransferase (LPLAT)-like uncharacterized protein
MTVRRGPSDFSREPFKYRFLITVLGTTAYRLFTLAYRSSRKYWINRDIEERFFTENRPIILAHYHRWDIFYFFAFRQRRHVIMCGDRWGGDLGAFLMAKVGIETVRRTTRPMDKADPSFISGTQAKQELIRLMVEEYYSAAISVDGPHGPIFSVKQGVVDLAAATGSPIVTMSVAAYPHIAVPTWDRMPVPVPFGSIVTVFGGPFYVTRGADGQKRAEMIRTIERHMAAVKDLCEEASADRKKVHSLVRGDIPIPPYFPEKDR